MNIYPKLSFAYICDRIRNVAASCHTKEQIDIWARYSNLLLHAFGKQNNIGDYDDPMPILLGMCKNIYQKLYKENVNGNV